MLNPRKMRAVALALVVAMLPVSVSAAPNRQQQQQLLDEVNSNIRNLDSLKDEVDKDLNAASKKMTKLMDEQAKLQEQIDELQAKIDKNNEKLEEIQEIKAQNYEAMKIRIQYMYEHGMEDTIWNSIVSAKTIGDTLKEIEYCRTVYKRDRDRIAEYEAAAEEEVVVKAELDAQLEEVLDKAATAANKQEELGVYIASMQDKASEYASQLARAESLAESYEKALERLDNQSNSNQSSNDSNGSSSNQSSGNSSGESSNSGSSSSSSSSGNFDGTIGGPNPISKKDANIDSSVSYLKDDSKNPKKQTDISQTDLIEYALQFVGNPYVWGGNSLTNGCDCSGFVKLIYQHFGIETPRYSQDFKRIGKPVGYSNLQPGDIVVYPGHVAMYVGDGIIVEAQSKRTGITCYRPVSRSASKITAIRRVL